MIGIYGGTVTKEFIERRNEEAAKLIAEGEKKDMAYFRWECEFPEYDAGNFQDIGHKWIPGFCPDTIHEEWKACDWKFYAKAGAKVSETPQRWIREGKIDTVVLWRFLENRVGKPLKIGEFVGYEILHYIPAKIVLEGLQNNRYVV